MVLVCCGAVLPPNLLGIDSKNLNAEKKNRLDNQYDYYIIINYLIKQKQLDKAVSLIDEYLEKNPEDPFILTEKAVILSETKGMYEKALDLLKKSKSTYPDYYYTNYSYAFILFNLTKPGEENSIEDKNKIEEAVKYLEVAIKNNPDFFDSYYLLGVINNTRGKYKASNQNFSMANRLNQTASCYLYMASNYMHMNDHNNAMKAYKEILTFNPSNFRALSALSRYYMDKSEYNTALVYLEKLYQTYPKNRNVSFEYLYALVADGENDKFMQIVNKIDISDSPTLLYAKALILTHEKKYIEAQQLLDQMSDKDLKIYYLLAEIQLPQHYYYQAYQILENIEINQRDYLYYSMKLRVLSLMDLNGRIIRLFDSLSQNKNIMQSLELDDLYLIFFACARLNLPDKIINICEIVKKFIEDKAGLLDDLKKSLISYSQRKKLLDQLPHYDLNVTLIETLFKKNKLFNKAISLIQQRLLKDSNNENMYLELCDLYFEQKKFDKLEILLEKIGKKFPSSLTIKNYHAYYLAISDKDLKFALELSSPLIKQEGENPAYCDTFGYVLLKTGRLSEAGKYLKKAYQKHPFEIEIMEHLADYYRSQKDFDRIKEIYKKAIDHDVDFKKELLKKVDIIEND